MNMISIAGEVKHDLIGWDSIPEIYTREELERRVLGSRNIGARKLRNLYASIWLKEVTIQHNNLTKMADVYYYGKGIFSFN